MNRVLVEPPGTAPGSDPSIMSAFITIVRVAPDTINIGAAKRRCKGCLGRRLSLCDPAAKGEGGIEQGDIGEACLMQQGFIGVGRKHRQQVKNAGAGGISWYGSPRWRAIGGKSSGPNFPRFGVLRKAVMGHHERRAGFQASVDLAQGAQSFVLRKEMQGQQTASNGPSGAISI